MRQNGGDAQHREFAVHGEKETSQVPRIAWVLLHAGSLAAGAWLLLRPESQADMGRSMLLIAFGAVMWLRMALTAFVFLQRRFGWGEMAGTTFATLLYQAGFAWLASRQSVGLDGWDVLGGALFVFGSLLNTLGEWQRRRFKAQPENKGRLFAGGLWRHVRHVNYLGDVLWVSGWALATRNPWAALIPLLLVTMFRFAMIPDLERYLERKYGTAFETWKSRSWALVPLVY